MELFNKIPKPVWIGIGAVAGLAVAAVAVMSLKKEESYRQIKVYEIEGSVSVTRNGNATMEPYVNMMLQNKDEAKTETESYMQLQLDEDKYILVEPSSRIKIEATGDAADSKTKINLLEGAIVNRIENPLSEESTYEITTPNSTMAVRGTVFRVEISYDENGESYAAVTVYEGKVVCNLIKPDGTVSEEEVVLEAGQQIKVHGNTELSEYLGEKESYDYEEFKDKVLSFIGYKNEETSTEPGKQTTEPGDSTEETDSDTTPTDTTQRPDAENTGGEDEQEEDPEVTPNSVDPDDSAADDTDSDSEENDTKNSNTGNTNPDGGSSNAGNTNPDGGSSNAGNTNLDSGNGDAGNTNPDDGNGDAGNTNPDSGNGDAGNTDPDPGTGDTNPASYTVTFQYNGSIFATQTVKSGEKPKTPLLKPTASGAWNPDPSATEITADTVIEWK